MPLKDPVCGMAVTSHSFQQLEHMGRVYYFCSAGCKNRFAHNTLRFTHPETLQQPLPGELLSLHLLKGHSRWVLLLSLAAVLAALGGWLI